LQIVAEHESKGESMLPVSILTDLVRSYTTQATSVVPQFLAASFEMFRDGQSKWMENFSAMNPMAKMPGFEVMQAQQEAFLKAMTGGMMPGAGTAGDGAGAAKSAAGKPAGSDGDDLDAIRRQLADLQQKLSKLDT
jgi:polyhydroxyalkanoate synthesis regulator protein